ncbi:alpha/beta fold hydrolase [Allosaccharopolyspora coralli]|uniref:Alpha/beta fold hydrolase n=1 Tax=Allosaccharopolyspora coralli TaxID=2665642 RepID=A0A5Q3Q871_9PSEU|nr:alpha/beta hydrolase [Allosaccharopolyspora coralli]QGK70758.1 alpha/beta fold hydrolase [Allosaccharopolyspora coralli]
MSPPILLVHGAWTGGWAWQDVVSELEGSGLRAHTVDLPTQGPAGNLSADAETVRAALEGLDEPAVLVGHSYAGMVITAAAAGNDRVAHLVYVCAALPREGESLQDLMGRDPSPSTIGDGFVMHDDGTAGLDRKIAREIVFNDATDEQVAPVLDSLGVHQVSSFGETAPALGWREHRSTYVVCTQDRVFSPELQRDMAQHTNRAVDVDSGHGPMLTRPAELAEVVRGTVPQ